MITKEEAVRRFSYDQFTGLITMKISSGSRKAGDVVGSMHRSKRLTILINGKQYQASRIAWLLHYGTHPEGFVDHINHDATDNRIKNLRLVTHQENCRNQRVRRTNKSGVMGVYWCNKNQAWCVQSPISGKRKHLGYFDNIFEAAAAKKSAELSEGFHENHGKNL